MPNQVLLSKNFHPRPGCGQKSLKRKSRVGGEGQNSILRRVLARVSSNTLFDGKVKIKGFEKGLEGLATNSAQNIAKNAPQNRALLIRGQRKKGAEKRPELMRGREFLAPTPSLFETSDKNKVGCIQPWLLECGS